MGCWLKLTMILILFTITGCIGKQEDRSYKASLKDKNVTERTFSPLDSLLKSIDKQLNGTFDPPIQLYATKDFNFLYNNSEHYYKDITRVIGDERYSHNKKLICVYAMQKMELQRYLQFSKYCLQLLNTNKLKEDIFYFVILPIGWNTDIRFAESYRNEDVAQFLRDALMSEKNSDRLRGSLSRIASGEMLENRKNK